MRYPDNYSSLVILRPDDDLQARLHPLIDTALGGIRCRLIDPNAVYLEIEAMTDDGKKAVALIPHHSVMAVVSLERDTFLGFSQAGRESHPLQE